MRSYKKNLSVIGLGYIGLPFLLSLTRTNFKLYGIDNNKRKIETLKNRKFFSEEANITKLYKRTLRNRITYSTDIKKSEVYILCLPTPINKKKVCDTKILDSVLNKLTPILKEEDLIIIESTVPIGYTNNILKKIKGKLSKVRNISVAYVCEKAMPGNTLYEMINNDRIIGCANKDRIKLKKIYKTFVKGRIYFTDFKIAEAVKLVENTYRDFNIGLAHYLKNILNKKNLDHKKVFQLSNKHPRVNILKTSLGVGGHCLPVDPYFLDNKKNGLINKIRSINDNQTKICIKKLKHKLNTYKNNKICFWGLGYKTNSLDLRNSPALKIYNSFKGNKYFASEIKNDLKVKNFLSYKEAISKIKHHVLLNVSNKNEKKYFKNKIIIRI